MITKAQILATIEAALENLVEQYNEKNDREVDMATEGGEKGTIYTIDGGDVDGAYEVTVSVDEI